MTKQVANGTRTIIRIAAGCAGVFMITACLTGGGIGAWYVWMRDSNVDAEFAPEADKRVVNEQLTQKSKQNLIDVMKGIHVYHDHTRRVPSFAIVDSESGKQLLSWRVSILPHVGEAALFEQIRAKEPWDSEHNRQFWGKMPAVYLLPGKENNGKTYYQVFRSRPSPENRFSSYPGRSMFPAWAEGGPPFRPPFRNPSITLSTITDGTQNTLAVVEAAEAVHWMSPDDIAFVAGAAGFPIDKIGNHWGNNRFLAAFADGSVHSLRRDLTPAELQGLITVDGGESIDLRRLKGH